MTFLLQYSYFIFYTCGLWLLAYADNSSNVSHGLVQELYRKYKEAVAEGV